MFSALRCARRLAVSASKLQQLRDSVMEVRVGRSRVHLDDATVQRSALLQQCADLAGDKPVTLKVAKAAFDAWRNGDTAGSAASLLNALQVLSYSRVARL